MRGVSDAGGGCCRGYGCEVLVAHEHRAVRGGRSGGSRGDGHRVPRTRHAARPARRAQGALGRPPGSGRTCPAGARGPSAGPGRASVDRVGVRGRGLRGLAVHRDGAHGRRHARGLASRAAAGLRHRGAVCGGGGGTCDGAPGRARAPRLQARERDARRAWPRAGHRLWAGQRRNAREPRACGGEYRRCADPDGHGPRHARVHGPRAAQGGARRPPFGSVQLLRRALRSAGGAPSVRRRDRPGSGGGDGAGAGHTASSTDRAACASSTTPRARPSARGSVSVDVGAPRPAASDPSSCQRVGDRGWGARQCCARGRGYGVDVVGPGGRGTSCTRRTPCGRCYGAGLCGRGGSLERGVERRPQGEAAGVRDIVVATETRAQRPSQDRRGLVWHRAGQCERDAG